MYTDKEAEILVWQRKNVQLKDAAAAKQSKEAAAGAPSGQQEQQQGQQDGTGVQPSTAHQHQQLPEGMDVEALKELKQQLTQRDGQVEERDAALSQAER